LDRAAAVLAIGAAIFAFAWQLLGHLAGDALLERVGCGR
jgi:hypothetical protein